MTQPSRPARGLTYRDAIHEVLADDHGVLTTRDVVAAIDSRR